MGTVLARLKGVSVGYAGRAVLHDIDLDILSGRQLAVLGASGAGKSTLLKLLSRELPPLRGEFSSAGVREGVVGQDPDLFEWLTLRENIALGLKFGANRPSQDGRVDEVVDLLGLSGVVDRYPDEVSGGQAQRASLARALAISPDLLLLDEPFSALDPATRQELQRWLRTTADSGSLTSVLVTHDLDEALVVADEIVLVDRRGRLTRSWVNDRPASDATQALVHPLRTQLRRAYSADAEAGDEEFSGFAVIGGGRRG